MITDHTEDFLTGHGTVFPLGFAEVPLPRRSALLGVLYSS